ncbi:secretion protein HlyD family protein [Methylobacterium sp. 4-46]|uniref:HlyD family secretion protein n=1 Tax=unclassified Methylobacterium TaxID=2615210 RepID=UPI000152D984|nr:MULTISPECIES: HlyD family efflux transporter periplasmic adaptor subunit [Methylobacterium]ACA14744.1 secretion protein HlyD family protein [Methylobacterium sp. 4-46]WFT80496.1 HlyD family efflux transporter periplasmic adaptor subunit [Methylobacterium nodulans]
MTGSSVLLRFGVPALAAGLFGFTAWSVSAKYDPRPITEPVIAAPANSYAQGVSAAGIIEPASEVVAIATERSGVVSRVEVVAGAGVTAGRPLFSVDDREVRAVVARHEGALAAAEALLSSADLNIAMQRHKISQAAAELENAQAESSRAELDRLRYASLARGSWVSRQRYEAAIADAGKAAAAVAAAEAAVAAAKQQSKVLTAKRLEAEANVAQSKAALEQARVDLDRTVVKAPIDGKILKVNVRVGEYAQAGALSSPLMIMGSADLLHVRADVDEADSWRINAGSPAVARLRGNPKISAPLSFVRIEPYVVPKRSLTGASTERVDTRVLQVIYALQVSDFPAFVGQQVDVFIKTDSPQGVAELRRDPAEVARPLPACPQSLATHRGCRIPGQADAPWQQAQGTQIGQPAD